MAPAITATLPVPTSQSTTQTRPATAGKTTYLNRCVEDLSPAKVAGCERKALLWNVVSRVSTVAFFALSVSTFMVISIHAPIYAPLVGMGILLLAMPAAELVLKFREWSLSARDEAERCRILQRYMDLTHQSPQELQSTLSQMGMTCDPFESARLAPLLAQTAYLNWKRDRWLQEEEKTLAMIMDCTRKSCPQSEKEKDIEMHNRHLRNIEDQIQHLKIQKAFVHAVLRKPDFCGTLGDLGDLAEIDRQDRLARYVLNDPQAVRDPDGDQLFTFFDPKIAPLTSKNVKSMSVTDLSQRFFEAMASLQ